MVQLKPSSSPARLAAPPPPPEPPAAPPLPAAPPGAPPPPLPPSAPPLPPPPEAPPPAPAPAPMPPRPAPAPPLPARPAAPPELCAPAAAPPELPPTATPPDALPDAPPRAPPVPAPAPPTTAEPPVVPPEEGGEPPPPPRLPELGGGGAVPVPSEHPMAALQPSSKTQRERECTPSPVALTSAEPCERAVVVLLITDAGLGEAVGVHQRDQQHVVWLPAELQVAPGLEQPTSGSGNDEGDALEVVRGRITDLAAKQHSRGVEHGLVALLRLGEPLDEVCELSVEEAGDVRARLHLEAAVVLVEVVVLVVVEPRKAGARSGVRVLDRRDPGQVTNERLDRHVDHLPADGR